MVNVLKKMSRGVNTMAVNALKTMERTIKNPHVLKTACCLAVGTGLGGVVSLFLETPAERKYDAGLIRDCEVIVEEEQGN